MRRPPRRSAATFCVAVVLPCFGAVSGRWAEEGPHGPMGWGTPAPRPARTVAPCGATDLSPGLRWRGRRFRRGTGNLFGCRARRPRPTQRSLRGHRREEGRPGLSQGRSGPCTEESLFRSQKWRPARGRCPSAIVRILSRYTAASIRPRSRCRTRCPSAASSAALRRRRRGHTGRRPPDDAPRRAVSYNAPARISSWSTTAAVIMALVPEDRFRRYGWSPHRCPPGGAGRGAAWDTMGAVRPIRPEGDVCWALRGKRGGGTL